jgi:hypothetical protein
VLGRVDDAHPALPEDASDPILADHTSFHGGAILSAAPA